MIEFSDQLKQSQLMTAFIFPWVFMVLAAAWFGYVAHRRGQHALLWAIGGALLGLLVTTFAEGIAHATAVPYSESQRAFHRVVALVISNVIIGGIGIVLTLKMPHAAKPEA